MHQVSPRPCILVADYSPVVRFGVRHILDAEGDFGAIHEASSFEELITLAAQTSPRLLIVDLNFPGTHALSIVERIRESGSKAAILVYTHKDESVFAERVLKQGAGGFLPKSAPLEELVSAVRRVLEGTIYLSSQMTDTMLRQSVAGMNSHDPDSQLGQLTNRELQVLELLGDGKTTREIAVELSVSPKTVETHRENIKAKLNLQSATKLMCYAVQRTLREG